MKYGEMYFLLKKRFNQNDDVIDIPEFGAKIVNCTFTSAGHRFLPGAQHYACADHAMEFSEEPGNGPTGKTDLHVEGLSVPDAHFTDNSEFRYSIFLPTTGKKPAQTILLFHGLNERYWFKYLPWAVRLLELTGSAVCLVPIAFHMNRAPLDWSNPRKMALVAEARRNLFPSIEGSSFANAAISARLHSIPQRFFWSGVQTYDDIIQLVGAVRRGDHPYLDSGCRLNIFAYSIGSFLSEILLMADEGGMFTRSKVFLFCGGPTFDRMYPVSKYIIDSEVLIALYAFFVEHLENECKIDRRLAHHFNEGHPAGLWFKAMLSIRTLKAVREARFAELADRIMAVPLRKDTVIQPGEVLNTLQGDFRNIAVPVQIMDFDYRYLHVNPFPEHGVPAGEVDRAFNRVFELAASYFGAR
jgi:hypothetical protein